jgi:hypothetical protein
LAVVDYVASAQAMANHFGFLIEYDKERPLSGSAIDDLVRTV